MTPARARRVRVELDQGDFFAVTSNSGGYAIPITATGDYGVTFSGSMITIPDNRTVTVASPPVCSWIYITRATAPGPSATTGSATSVDVNSAVLNGTVSPNGLTTTYYFEYGTTTAYGLATASRTTDADASASETLGGLSADTTYHYRLVATNSSGTGYGPDRSFQTTASPPRRPPAGEAGGGSGCFLTTAAAAMDPGDSGRTDRRHRRLSRPARAPQPAPGVGRVHFRPAIDPPTEMMSSSFHGNCR